MSNKSEITLHIELQNIEEQLKGLENLMDITTDAKEFSNFYEKWYALRDKGLQLAQQIKERL